MAKKKKNVFTPDLNKFLGGCGDLVHLLNFTQWQTRDALKRIDSSLKELEKRGWDQHHMTATRLSIVDIFHDGEYITRAPSVLRITGGENVKKLAIEMEGRFNAYTLVSLHEILEDYLRDVFGKLRYQLRDEETIRDKKKFHRSYPEWANCERTPHYYKHYAKYVCKRDCKRAIADFERLLAWENVKITHWRGMTVPDLISTIGFCRHRTVHEGGRVTDEDLRELDKDPRRFVRSCIRTGVHGGHKLILPDKKTISRCVEILASYGYGLYVLLARKCNMRIEYEPGKDAERITQPKGRKARQDTAS